MLTLTDGLTKTMNFVAPSATNLALPNRSIAPPVTTPATTTNPAFHEFSCAHRIGSLTSEAGSFAGEAAVSWAGALSLSA